VTAKGQPEDLSSGKDVRRRRLTAKQREDQFAADLEVVISSTTGRRFVWSLLEEAQIFRDAFAAEAAGTAYVLGQQAYGKKLFGLLNTHRRMKSYAQMVEENTTNG
jgi:hypothetical protein